MAIELSSERRGPGLFNCFDFSSGLLYHLLKKTRPYVHSGGWQMKGMRRERGGIHYENKTWNIRTSHHKKWCMLWEPGKNWSWKPPKSRVYSNRSGGKHEEGLSIKATGWSNWLDVDASASWLQLPKIRLFYESPMEKKFFAKLIWTWHLQKLEQRWTRRD